MIMNKLASFIFTSLLFLQFQSFASIDHIRVMANDDPSTRMTIGWSQVSGNDPIVYYDIVDHQQNWEAYEKSQVVTRSINYIGFNHQFVRLENLLPSQKYFFVIKDSEGTSERFWFETVTNNPNDTLVIIAGGDSRTGAPVVEPCPCRENRQKGNTIVSKLRPDIVFFDGDFVLNLPIVSDKDQEWLDWLNDWKLTISEDNRLTPLSVANGNHEDDEDVNNIFDVLNSDDYYALTLGGSLMRMYNLNTEISVAGAQTDWLMADLTQQDDIIWKSAQYHRPMVPHVGDKDNGVNQYNNWAQIFFDQGFSLVLEGDAHTCKATWPIKPGTGKISEDGFERDDRNGTVYVGEGTWGAPIREADDVKIWTRNSAALAQLKWIFVSKYKIEVRTVIYDNANEVEMVNDLAKTTPPNNLILWKPSNGEVITIPNYDYAPFTEITFPKDDAFFDKGEIVPIKASATDPNNDIVKVEFFVNDELVATDLEAPFETSFSSNEETSYSVKAKIFDELGLFTTSMPIDYHVGNITVEARICSSNDDAEENLSNGDIDLTSSDLELIYDDGLGGINSKTQLVGLHFPELKIPQNVDITNSFLQFTSDGDESSSTSLIIKGEKSGDSPKIEEVNGNLSQRIRTDMEINWSPESWGGFGETSDKQKSSDLARVVQEIIDQDSWRKGNNMTFLISGTGTRKAVSFDGDSEFAALLSISYTADPQVISNTEEPLDYNSAITRSIYPNPTTLNSIIHVNLNIGANAKSQYELYDRAGVLVKYSMNSKNTFDIDLTTIAAGHYFLKVVHNDQVEVNKIIIQ